MHPITTSVAGNRPAEDVLDYGTDPSRFVEWQQGVVGGEVTVEAFAAERLRLAIAIDFEGRGIGKLFVPLIVRREARNEMPRNLAG